MYADAILVCTMVLAFITAGRIAYVLGKRWGFDSSNPPLWEGFCAISATAIFYHVSNAAFDFGGTMGSLIALVGTVPLVGLVFIFVVGANKAIERILHGLLKKVG